MCRGTEKAKPAACWLAVQVTEVMRDGENVLSQGMSTSVYGREVVEVRLPRKALNTISQDYLYPKPTQVGRLRKLKGAR